METRFLSHAWHATTLPGIIRPMPTSRFTPRRMTAALLPLTFLWLCAACAFTCGGETAGAEGPLHAGPSAELAVTQGEPQCEDCPFVAFPKATASERMAFDAGSQTAAADAPPSSASYFTAVAVLVQPRAQAPPVAPPLQLLPTLRI